MALPDATFIVTPNPNDGIQRLDDPDGLLTPIEPIYPVDNLAVTDNSTDSQEVSWSYNHDVDSYDNFEYRLWDSAKHTGWQAIVTLPKEARNYRPVETLTSNSSIGHRVRAVRANGEASEWVEVWRVTESTGYVPPDVPGVPDPGEYVYRKFGKGDWDSSQNPHFRLVNPGYDTWWYFTRSEDRETPVVEDMAHWENNSECYWAQEPANPENYRSGRMIKPRRRGDMHVYAPNLPKTGTLYLTIRYKDQVLGQYNNGGYRLNYRNGNDEGGITIFRELVTIPCVNDKRWKTKQFAIDASTLIWQGDYFYLSWSDEYSDQSPGEFVLDRMKISTTNHTADFFPADEAGFWPQLAQPNRHANIRNTHEWRIGETPKFRYGIFIGFGVSIGETGNATTPTIHPDDDFQLMEDCKMNAIINHSSGTPLDSFYKEVPQNTAPAGCKHVEIGGPEMLVHAGAHGLELWQNPLTHVEAYSIDKVLHDLYPGRSYLYEHMPDVIETFQTHPDLYPHHFADPSFGGWFWHDESDHDFSDHKTSLTACRWTYASAKNADPDRPVMGSQLGFHRDVIWDLYAPTFDVIGCDKYFYDSSNGTWESLELGVRKHCWYIDDANRILDDSKLVFGIPCSWQYAWDLREFPGGKRNNNRLEIEMQAWALICHGVTALFYFRYAAYWKGDDANEVWIGQKNVGELLFGTDGIADWLVMPATTLDIGLSPVVPSSQGNGAWDAPVVYESQEGLISAPEDIHFIYKDLAGQRLLILFNGRYVDRVGVQIAVDVADGSYNVRGEGRQVNVSGGILTDTFAKWEGHAYELW